MPIQTIERNGQTRYKVQLRRRGHPPAFKTFDRFGDASPFEERTLREQESRAAYGCNVTLAVGDVIARTSPATTT